MTAFATGLALLPLAITGNKPGQEIEYPLAVVILGGLVTSTLLNLFLLPPLYAKSRTGDILHSQADISAAAEAFGYRALVSVEEGLQRTVEWYRETLKIPVASR